MFKTLLTLFRVALIAFLAVGTIATFGQVAGVILGDPDLMIFAGTSISDNAGILASMAGILAFSLLYTRQGREAAEAQME